MDTRQKLEVLARRLADSYWASLAGAVGSTTEAMSQQKPLIAVMLNCYGASEMEAFNAEFRCHSDRIQSAYARDRGAEEQRLLHLIRQGDGLEIVLGELRFIARDMVHRHWRRLFTENRGDLNVIKQMAADFTERSEAVAAWLRADEADAFLQEIEAERGRMSDEYERDGLGLKRRLGVAPAGPQKRAAVAGAIAGEVARTAVRVTLWEGIRRAIFGR